MNQNTELLGDNMLYTGLQPEALEKKLGWGGQETGRL